MSMSTSTSMSTSMSTCMSTSTTDDIRRVGVVGAGLMGSGIAEVCARAGLDVVVGEAGPAAVEAGHRRITSSLDRAVRRHKLTEAERDATLRRIRFTTDLADMADRDAVVEAVAEDEQVKTGVFAALDKVVTRPSAILASTGPLVDYLWRDERQADRASARGDDAVFDAVAPDVLNPSLGRALHPLGLNDKVRRRPDAVQPESRDTHRSHHAWRPEVEAVGLNSS